MKNEKKFNPIPDIGNMIDDLEPKAKAIIQYSLIQTMDAEISDLLHLLRPIALRINEKQAHVGSRSTSKMDHCLLGIYSALQAAYAGTSTGTLILKEGMEKSMTKEPAHG